MERKKVTKADVKAASVRATRQSAALERRTLPDGHVRSEGVKRVLAERRRSA